MEVNKVVYNGDTLLDLTSDTVTPQTLLSGATAHAANGQSISGTVDLNGKADKVANATAGHFAGLDSSGNLTDSGKSASNFATPTDLAAKQPKTLDTPITIGGTSRTTVEAALGALNTAKVDAETGKGLSTNDYTTTEKNKLGGIATGATANTVIDTSCTLTAAGWTGSAAPYTQTVNVTGVLATDKPVIDIEVSSTVQTGLDEIEQYSYISKAVAGAGSITFSCYEDKPDIALTVSVKVVR